MLRQILVGSIALSGFMIAGNSAIAQGVKVCTPDLVCTDTGTPAPKGTVIRGEIAKEDILKPMVGKPESDCREHAKRYDLYVDVEYQNGIAYCYFYPKTKSVAISPRSDRGNPKPSTIDSRRAFLDLELRPCRTNNPRKEGRCIIKTLAPVAVEAPTSDGKSDRVYPGLPPAPKLIAQVTPQSCPSGVVLVDENGKLVCG